MKTCIFALLTLALSTTAHATTWNQNTRYWVSLNFSSTAFGKQVSGVYAHIGALLTGNTCSSFLGNPGDWANVQHVKLDRVGDHFFGKVKLTAHAGECTPSVGAPIVEYWVYFTDGTEMKTQASQVPFVDFAAGAIPCPGQPGYSDNDSDADREFARTMDASSTQAVRYVCSWAD